MMGQNHRKIVRCVCTKELPIGLYYLCTILRNLALGHEIDRHIWKGVELK